MTKRQWERFDWLVLQSSLSLNDPMCVAMEIRRGDMLAIIAAYTEIQRYSHKEDLARDKAVMKAEGRSR